MKYIPKKMAELDFAAEAGDLSYTQNLEDAFQNEISDLSDKNEDSDDEDPCIPVKGNGPRRSGQSSKATKANNIQSPRQLNDSSSDESDGYKK